MKEYFLQTDIPGFNSTEEKQIMVNETQFNEAIQPVNSAFSGLKEVGDWVFFMISNMINDIFGKMI